MLGARRPLVKPDAFKGRGASYSGPTATAIMFQYCRGVPQRHIAALLGTNTSYVQRVIREWNERTYNRYKDKAIAAKTAKRTTKKAACMRNAVQLAIAERRLSRSRDRCAKVGILPRNPVDESMMRSVVALLRSRAPRDEIVAMLGCSFRQVEIAEDYLIDNDPTFF